jgi:hypothetical protein
MVFDGEGSAVGTESFRSAPGPMGWRYFSEIDAELPAPHHAVVDLAVDAGWRVARVRLDTGDHHLLLEPRGGALAGYRDGAEFELPYGPDDHLDLFTPATNLITTRRLQGDAEIDVLFLAPVTLEATRVRQRYEMGGPDRIETPSGRFDAVRWTFTALDSGWSADLWVAGDTVVAYDTLFELASYEAGVSGDQPLT